MSHDAIDLKIPQKVKIDLKALSAIIVGVCSITLTFFWLYSDKHNTAIFVPREEYKKDQQIFNEQYQRDQKGVANSLERIERVQEESQKDIKQILKDNKK